MTRIAAAAIVNPAAAGGKTGQRWDQSARALAAAGLDVETFFTERRGHATELARSALAAGHRRVIAVGGDGTLNEVANAFFDGSAPLHPGARLGMLPQGTGGDFRRTLGIPSDLEGAAALLASDAVVQMDVGLVSFVTNGFAPARRVFVNIADLGIGGEVVSRVEGLKSLGGRAAFQVASLVALMRYRNRDVRIDADGESFTIRAQQVVVANCRYFGGGMMVAPTADPADGLLDVVVVGDLGRLESMRKMGSIYRGTHLDDPQVAHRRARRVEVACDTTLLLDVDGEQPGMAPATFEVMPRALGMIGNAPVTRV